jgi:hypothetical protein
MNFSEQKDEKLLKILREAYLEKEKLEADNRWPESVMRRIRNMREIEIAPSSPVGFTQFTWKLAPVTALLILALTAFLIGSGLTPVYEVFEFVMDGTEPLTIVQLFTT